MITLVRSNGTEFDAELSIDAIVDYEAAHPDWSIMDTMQGMDRLRLTNCNILASFVRDMTAGRTYTGYAEWVDDGLTMQDLAAVFEKSKFLGFTDSEPTIEE